MNYPTPMDVAEAEDKEAMTDPFADELAKCSVLYTENLVAEREALIAEIAKEREAHIDDVARLRRQVDEAVECCIIKDNRNLRLETRLAEAMRLLAKEGIHMDDHGCWCNPTVIDYSDGKVKHE